MFFKLKFSLNTINIIQYIKKYKIYFVFINLFLSFLLIYFIFIFLFNDNFYFYKIEFLNFFKILIRVIY